MALRSGRRAGAPRPTRRQTSGHHHHGPIAGSPVSDPFGRAADSTGQAGADPIPLDPHRPATIHCRATPAVVLSDPDRVSCRKTVLDNPFLPLSFIAGPAILTNASTVLLNGASIRYNLAIGLWRDLQAELHGHGSTTGFVFIDRRHALMLAQRRVVYIVRALNLLYAAVGGFGLSTLTGLSGALLAEGGPAWATALAKVGTLSAGGFALVCLLLAAGTFTFESRCTIGLLKLGIPKIKQRREDDEI